MDNLNNLSISKAITFLKKKEISVTELINAHIAAMESSRELNAFITETADLARNAASISDKNYAQGNERPLEAVSYTHLTLPTKA